MRTRSICTLLGVVAAIMMAFAAPASARNLSITIEQRFDIKWARLSFSNSSIGIRITCPVTLEGSFHSATIMKRVGLLVGYITGANINEAACEGGIVHINRETLPWHLTYEGFRGALPNITGVTFLLLRATWELDPAGLLPRCRSVTEAGHRAQGIASVVAEGGGILKIERFKADETAEIPCREAGGASLGLRQVGEADVFALGSTRRLLLRLL